MLEEGDEIRALLMSNDEGKKCRGLSYLKKQAASNGSSSVATLLPFVIQKFISQPIKQDRAKKGALLTRKLAYSLLPVMPVYGSSWVTISNAIDRDLQAAVSAGEKNPPMCEVGVCALRTLLSMPYGHVEEYVRSRWEVICGIAMRSKIITLRTAACDALIIACTPPVGLERHEQEGLVMRAATKPHFGEMIRKLLTDPEGQVTVKAFGLLGTLQLATNANRMGSGVCLVGPMPQYMIHTLGISQEVCQEILHSVSRLSLKQQQCIQHPLLSLCLTVVKGNAGLVSMLLSLSDTILHQSLHSDWNSAVVVNAAISLLSIVTHHKGLLLSLFPHLTLCVDKILGVIQKQTAFLRDWSLSIRESLALAAAAEKAEEEGGKSGGTKPGKTSAYVLKLQLLKDAIPVAPLPSSILEVLGSLLKLMPLEQRLRHCLTLAKTASNINGSVLSELGGGGGSAAGATGKGAKNSTGDGAGNLEAQASVDFVKGLMVMVAQTLTGAIQEQAQDFATVAQLVPEIKKGRKKKNTKTAAQLSTVTGVQQHQLHLPDAIAPIVSWLAHNCSTLFGETCVLELLSLMASALHTVTADIEHLTEQATTATPGTNQAQGPPLTAQVQLMMLYLLVHRVVLVLFCSGSSATGNLWVRSEGFRAIVEVNAYFLFGNPAWTRFFADVVMDPSEQAAAVAAAATAAATANAVGPTASALAGKLGQAMAPQLARAAGGPSVSAAAAYHLGRDGHGDLCRAHTSLLESLASTVTVAEGALPMLVALSHPVSGTGANRNKLLAWLELLSKVSYLKACSRMPLISPPSPPVPKGTKPPPPLPPEVQPQRPSSMLCSAVVAAVSPYLNCCNNNTEGGGGTPSLSQLSSSTFRKGFARCLRILQACYGASAKSGCCDEGAYGNTVTDYTHNELLPLWGHLQQAEARSPKALQNLLSYATKSVELYGYGSASNGEGGEVTALDLVKSTFSSGVGAWRAVLKGNVNPTFVSRHSRWSEGNKSLDRRVATRVVSADNDPVKVTMSYVMFPQQTQTPIEVTCSVANTTGMTLQQVVLTFGSVHCNPNTKAKELAGQSYLSFQSVASYAPKRSLFGTTCPTEIAPPSSHSHVSYRGQGCFVISSMAPLASVNLTVDYVMDAVLVAVPLPKAVATTGGIGNAEEVSSLARCGGGGGAGVSEYHDNQPLVVLPSSTADSSDVGNFVSFPVSISVVAKSHHGSGVSFAGMGPSFGDAEDGAGSFAEDDLFAAAAHYAEEAEEDADWLTGGGGVKDLGDDPAGAVAALDYIDPYARPKNTMVMQQRTTSLPLALCHFLAPIVCDAAVGGGSSSQANFSLNELGQSLVAALYPAPYLLTSTVMAATRGQAGELLLLQRDVASTTAYLYVEQVVEISREQLHRYGRERPSPSPLGVGQSGASACGNFIRSASTDAEGPVTYVSALTLEWLNLKAQGGCYANSLGSHRQNLGGNSPGAAFFGMRVVNQGSGDQERGPIRVSCRLSQAGQGGWMEGQEDGAPKWLLDIVVGHPGFHDFLVEVAHELAG